MAMDSLVHSNNYYKAMLVSQSHKKGWMHFKVVVIDENFYTGMEYFYQLDKELEIYLAVSVCVCV